jgi:hypothetical protein
VSGREVPRATRVIAVIESSMPRRQPNISAKLPTTAVTMPIYISAMTNDNLPPIILVGGTDENRTFQKIEVKWTKASYPVTFSTIMFS